MKPEDWKININPNEPVNEIPLNPPLKMIVFQKIDSGKGGQRRGKRKEEQTLTFAVNTSRWVAPFRDGVREGEK
jgi:hypothetical protein